MDNNYYNYKTPYYDTPNADKYQYITNVSQIRNYYIKQLNSNEFIIKCNNAFWGILAFFLSAIVFLTIFILVLLYDKSENNSKGGAIFGIAFSGFLTVIGLFSFLGYRIRHKIILTENYIQIKAFHIFWCANSTKNYNYNDIKCFEVDIEKEKDDDGVEQTKNIDIIYWNNSNEKKYLFDHNFELEEAEYFVYFVNNFINKRNNGMTIC